MEIKIDIDEKILEEMIQTQIAKEVVRVSQYRYEIKDAIGKSTKEMIYKNKDEIIEKVIARASAEMVKKGFVKFMDEFNDRGKVNG